MFSVVGLVSYEKGGRESACKELCGWGRCATYRVYAATLLEDMAGFLFAAAESIEGLWVIAIYHLVNECSALLI